MQNPHTYEVTEVAVFLSISISQSEVCECAVHSVTHYLESDTLRGI